ncbi:MAG: hypothetical protein JSS43_31535 [Proteobacteria bacterium]|nr:hypothetical protein [Pseudomonadota bacterium]
MTTDSTTAIAGDRRGDWLLRGAAPAAACLAAAIILLHGVLILGGHWSVDEYVDLTFYRGFGIDWFLQRLKGWSPRPASEIILYGYASSVLAMGSSLIAPFLAGLWALLAACALLPVRPALSGPGVFRLVAATGVLAMFLLGHRIDDVFYVPWSAAAYLPALAGVTLTCMTLVFASASRRRDHLVCCLGLSLAAASSETGLFAALGFGGLALLWWGTARLRRVPSGPAAWFVIPLLIALASMAVSAGTRVSHAVTPLMPDSVTFHRFGPSLIAALHDLPERLVGVGGMAADLPLVPSLAMRILLLLGLTLLCRAAMPTRLPPRDAAALVAGLLTSILLTSFAAHFQYGFSGFWRHGAFQQCMGLLLILVLGRLLGGLPVAPRHASGPPGALCLIAALVLGMAWRLPDLLHDIRLLPDIRAAQARTLVSGIDRSSNTMRFTLPPETRILMNQLPPGHYEEPARPGGPSHFFASAVLHYFGKSSVDVVPWPSDR